MSKITSIFHDVRLWIDAGRFVRVAEADARDVRNNPSGIVIMGASPGHNPRYGWYQMRSPEFRERVMAIIKRKGLFDRAEFSPPDSYDGWTFYADRKRKPYR